MAKLYITEYGSVAFVAAPVAQEPGVDQTPVTFTTSAQSAAFGAGTNYVRLQSDTDCFVKFGSNPTATANHQPLTANVESWRAVLSGHKIAVYDGSS